jgi:hypothetical protein
MSAKCISASHGVRFVNDVIHVSHARVSKHWAVRKCFLQHRGILSPTFTVSIAGIFSQH